MEPDERITQLICDAIAELNQTSAPERATNPVAEAVLLGPTGSLDSLAFVILAVTIEEKIERALGQRVSVLETAMAGVDDDTLTVAMLAEAIGRAITGVAHR